MAIQRYQDSSLALGPEQDGRIKTARREIGRVADANGVQGMDAFGVVALDGLPQSSAAQVFVEDVTQRHGSGRPRSLLFFAPSELLQDRKS
jgi:hypothetical protein